MMTTSRKVKTMSREIWKPIPGYTNYKVSNLGRVKSIYRASCKNQFFEGRILTPIRNNGGYLKVNLSKDGVRKEGKIHRLVLSAFVGECPEGMVVNHIDEDKTNNCLSNLEYVTPKENSNHGTCRERLSAILTGRKRSEESRMRIKMAKRRYSAKPVICIETGIVFRTAGDADKAVGIKQGVCHVCCGRQKSAGGLHWRYV